MCKKNPTALIYECHRVSKKRRENSLRKNKGEICVVDLVLHIMYVPNIGDGFGKLIKIVLHEYAKMK